MGRLTSRAHGHMPNGDVAVMPAGVQGPPLQIAGDIGGRGPCGAPAITGGVLCAYQEHPPFTRARRRFSGHGTCHGQPEWLAIGPADFPQMSPIWPPAMALPPLRAVAAAGRLQADGRVSRAGWGAVGGRSTCVALPWDMRIRHQQQAPAIVTLLSTCALTKFTHL